ncbi:MAG: hypothetical protein LIP05_04425 [Tannerellaceae bacterium]|nr:hypothetical protein [Tannerellaceae bacterium]
MKKISILLLSITLLLSSCKESFLDLDPELNPPHELIYTTPEYIRLTLDGLYGSIKNSYFLGGG